MKFRFLAKANLEMFVPLYAVGLLYLPNYKILRNKPMIIIYTRF